MSAALLPACPSSSSLRPSALLLPPPPTHPLALEASAALSQAQQQHRDADRTPTYPPRTPTHTHSMLQVLCLQETKLQESHVADALAGLGLPGWAATFSCSAEKKGYSGVATLCRQKPLSVVCGIGDAAHDGEGRVITVVRCAAICWGGGMSAAAACAAACCCLRARWRFQQKSLLANTPTTSKRHDTATTHDTKQTNEQQSDRRRPRRTSSTRTCPTRARASSASTTAPASG